MSDVASWLAQLRDGDTYQKMAAAKALGQSGDPAAVPALVAALDDGDEWVATDAAEALGHLGNAQAVPALLETLRAESWRRFLDTMLAGMNEAENVSHAAVAGAMVASSISDLRAAAAMALGQLGDPRAVPGLIEALHDDHLTAVRESAARALETLGTPDALAALQGWRSQGRGKEGEPGK